MRNLKKPSSTKRLPDPIFFTDRDLGRIIPDALERAGVQVERHDAHFGPTTLDVKWLAEVGARGWIGLTHNKEIRYNLDERDMVMRAGVPLFMLIGHYRHEILARNLVHTLPRIFSFLGRYERPFIARVYRAPEGKFERGNPGRVALWLSYEQWRKKVGE